MKNPTTPSHVLGLLGMFVITAAWHNPALSQITVNGGNLTMSVTSAAAGMEPTIVTNTTASLQFQKQNRITKITVSTTAPGQNFNLTVVATAVGGGTAAPAVSLVDGMLAMDFITGIPRRPPAGSFNATLLYTASATFAQGNSAELGNDVHTVTYTLVAQ